jgi:hypothetical protein
VPLQAKGAIETTTISGKVKDYLMEVNSFPAMMLEDVYCMRNKSNKAEFVFLIAQAPKGKYNFFAT